LQTGTLGRRIAIFGGGGKTTLASAIARKIGVPHIELDAFYHGPNWVGLAESEFAQIVEQRLDSSCGGWVTDGNYERVRPLILARADTALVIQMRFPVLFWRILKRSLRRAWSGEPMWNGNRETWRMTFASRESILLEIIAKRRRYADTERVVAGDAPSATNIVRIQGGRELGEFYRVHGLERR